jgi:ABC-type branched-subunit amino acid transport system ATPase component
MSHALRIDNLWKSYTAGVQGCSARVWALRGCSLTVEMGERVAVVGARGAGKRTLLHCIAGDRIDAGRIETTMPLRCHFHVEGVASGQYGENGVALVVPGLHLCSRPLDTREMAGAAIVASRDVASVHGSVDRIMLLRDGRLTPLTRVAVRRVAERIAGV